MNKIDRVRTYLQDHEIDALLVTSSYNLRYMTGFTGSSGIALITKDDACFITDFRYTEQASEQVKGYTVVEREQSMEAEVHKELQKRNIQSLAFEEDYVSFAKYQQYNHLFNIRLVPISGFIEKLRVTKDADEIKVIREAANIADETYHHI